MLSPKYRDNVKIALVTLAVVLMLFTKPVLGKKARSKSAKPRGGSQKSQQVKKRSSAAPKVRRPTNMGKTSTRVSAAPRSIRSVPKSNTSKLPRRITSGRTIKSGFRQLSGTGPSRHTVPRPKVTFNTSKSIRRSVSVSRPFDSSFGSKKLIGRSFSTRKPAAVSSNSRISLDKTSRIGNPIGEKKLLVTAPGEVTHGSKPKIRTAKVAENNSSTILRKPKATVKEPVKIAETSRERIGRTIKVDKNTGVATARKATGDSKPKIRAAKKAENNSREVLRKSESIVEKPEKGTKADRSGYKARKQVGLRLNNRTSSRSSSLFTRPAWERSLHTRPRGEKSQHIRVEGKRRPRSIIEQPRRHLRRRGRHPRVVYHERREAVKHVRRHEHVYRDYRGRIHHRIVWPRYRFAVYYNWGRHFAFRYVYPYYHRRYVFVSLGGYWPVGYRYVRYYWYGCHPYRWHGYYPIAREVRGDTYNYYTYNYYYDDDTAAFEPYQATGDIPVVDHTTFADVRERLSQEAAEEPYEQTLADSYFEDAIKTFEAGDYDLAAEMFTKAIELAPEDMILPFAYCQALFAGEKYTEAAEVLRTALAKVTPEKEGVFYPRGLYAKDDILFEQIERLAEKAELYSFDGDLQLLLGYQLLGIGEIDEAVEPLRLANQDLQNASSAAVLLGILEKIRIQSADDTD